MRRIVFPVLTLCPLGVWGQSGEIPGRDLLTFPIGLMAEAPALGTTAGTGLWNPATSVLPDGYHWRLSVAAMNAPSDIAVSAQLFSVSGDWRGTTMGLSVARAAVADIVRTDTDPQSIGNPIPYGTTVISLVAARRLTPDFTLGVAIRERSGSLDDVNRTGLSADVGVVAEHLTRLDVRIGASSFLLSPGAAAGERASWLFGADARVAGADSMHGARVGYSLQVAQSLFTEQYLFANARWGGWEVRGGPVRTDIFGGTGIRVRLGIVLHYAGYNIGVAREDGVNGLAPTYQFSLSSLLR
jgi:hypothetical protein